jgi:hypothetical protein
MSRPFCRACRYGDHNHCNGDVRDEYGNRQWCGCEPSHDYEAPEQPMPDPYHMDAAEDAYYDNLIGERWT